MLIRLGVLGVPLSMQTLWATPEHGLTGRTAVNVVFTKKRMIIPSVASREKSRSIDGGAWIPKLTGGRPKIRVPAKNACRGLS